MVHPDRLGPLDESFLHLESRDEPMHVGAVCRIEGEAIRKPDGSLDRERILDKILSRLHRVPRLRQRLALVPLAQGRPLWADDPRFNIHCHVSFGGLARPGGERELKEVAGRLLGQPLDRTRPLWQMHWIDGLHEGQVAMVWKIHHCLVDGVSGMQLAELILDLEPNPTEPEESAPWIPRPEPGPVRLLTGAWRDRMLAPREWLDQTRRSLRKPREFAKTLANELVGFRAWAGESLAPRTCINVPIGPHRRIDTLTVELAAVKRIKSVTGTTVNDVVLATVAGAFRRFFLHRHQPVQDVALHVAIPVNVRQASEAGALGNRVSAMMVDLPLDEPDPAALLGRIQKSMARLKDSHESDAAVLLTQLGGVFSGLFLHELARVQRAQRFISTIVTNVPGPQFPLYMCGARVLDIAPCLPLGPNMAVGVAVLSYDGQLCFGLIGDFAAMPDLDVLARHFRESFEALEAACP